MKAKNRIPNEDIVFKDENGKPYHVQSKGSLGILALGYRGILAWKKQLEKDKKSNE